jgi:ketosteroid isomerase-like protein
MYKFDPNNQDHLSIKSWFDIWQIHIQNKDYVSAQKLFKDDVVSFGTWMDVVEGLDKLCLGQRKNIWPTITDFKFLTNSLFIQISPDRLFSNSILVWSSLGYQKGGDSFNRSGRATVVLKKLNLDDSWKGIHTHFSLNRGVPQKSYGVIKEKSKN